MDATTLEGANGILVESESDINKEEILSVKKGAWSSQEDSLLINYIAIHGEGRWNFVARDSGLRRTGKSCRLRWKNYLRPDVRRGNFTLEEQFRIMELHCLYGNRWSKIAEFLIGRTDNEIKNYWRSRIVKQAKQLKYDINSVELREFVRDIWLPKLSERIHASECNNTSNNLENGMMSYDVTENSGSGPLQMDHGASWSNTISFEAPKAHQKLVTDNLSSNNGCKLYNMMLPGVGLRQPYYNDYDFQESGNFSELSNMLLYDNDSHQIIVTNNLSSSSDCGLYNFKWSGVDYNSNDFHGSDSFEELSNMPLYDDCLV